MAGTLTVASLVGCWLQTIIQNPKILPITTPIIGEEISSGSCLYIIMCTFEYGKVK